MRVTFKSIDHDGCGTCSLFNPEIVISAAAPNPAYHWKVTVNSSSGGDKWWVRMSFRHNGQEFFTVPGQWWWTHEIGPANQPSGWEEDQFTSPVGGGIPANFNDTTDVYLYGSC